MWLIFQYETQHRDGDTIETNDYNPAERANDLCGMEELAKFLSVKIEKLKNRQTLLPKRVIQRHFPVKVKQGAHQYS